MQRRKLLLLLVACIQMASSLPIGNGPDPVVFQLNHQRPWRRSPSALSFDGALKIQSGYIIRVSFQQFPKCLGGDALHKGRTRPNTLLRKKSSCETVWPSNLLSLHPHLQILLSQSFRRTIHQPIPHSRRSPNSQLAFFCVRISSILSSFFHAYPSIHFFSPIS